jgi:heat-inducible transcriptional repressor
MLQQLNERQRIILKYIVQEYVRTGRAVGSKTLIERYRIGVSPATVRNEMGELEERLYLQHPHTSAGRVPTDLGYRYYVEYLLDDLGLPPAEELRIRHQFGQVESQIEAWAKLAASILADVSGNLALVTPPRSAVERLRHMELISLRDQVVLLIVVTQSGGAQELILPTTEVYTQDELSAISRQLNDELVNMSAREILVTPMRTHEFTAIVVQRIAEALKLAQQQGQSEVFSEGLDRALQQPEFSQSLIALRLLELLRGGAILSALSPQMDFDDEVQVFIGTENWSEELQKFGVVVSTYGIPSALTGLVGVLGPTRMAYGRSISTVRYMAQLLSDLIESVYATSTDDASYWQQPQ